ncbi:MAG TPA: helix-turn-helix domain-containing protein [bacterium]|nr:helix-turn-helix domain-containing protein [bacterium]
MLIALVIGALLIAALLFRRDNRKANILLAGILAASLLYQYSQVVRVGKIDPRYPYLWGLGFIASVMIPALVYLYVLVLTTPGFRWKKSLWLHFAPSGLALAIAISAWVSLARVEGDPSPELRAWFRYFCTVLDVLVSGFYFYASYRQIRHYQSQLESFFSHLRKVRLLWLKILLLMVVLPWLVQVVDVLGGPFTRLETVTVPLITLIFLLMGFFGLRQSVLFLKDEDWPLPQPVSVLKKEIVAPPETRITFSEEKLEEWRRKLEKYMAEQKPYLDPELRLVHLSEAIGLKPYQVSEILNRGIRSNFYDYINRFRIEEAKRRLRDPAFAHMNILGIANDSGFNSKSVFNETFRKFTGATPSNFREMTESTASSGSA